MGQESWHSGYMDKGNEKYKNDYCQNVLKNDSISDRERFDCLHQIVGVAQDKYVMLDRPDP